MRTAQEIPLAATACEESGGSPQEPLLSLELAIARANEQFMQVFRQGDAASIAGLYTDDAELLLPQGTIARGRQAIEAVWQAAMDRGVTSVSLETLAVEDHGTMAFEVAWYTLRDRQGREIGLGQAKYIAVWQQVDGAWKLHRDIWRNN